MECGIWILVLKQYFMEFSGHDVAVVAVHQKKENSGNKHGETLEIHSFYDMGRSCNQCYPLVMSK